MTAPPISGNTIVGRDLEAARIRSVLHPSHGTGHALVITGEPGIGKSTLLDREVRHARETGLQVLRAEGSQQETDLAFAGLHQLLKPVLDRAESLPERQRDALLGAFGITAGPAEPGQLIIGIAVLSLLSGLAGTRPVLLVVDDAQWLDQDSLEVLGFVARRLKGERITMLSAVRSGARLLAYAHNHPVVDLGPLDAVAANQLLDAQPRRPAGRLRPRILAEAAGNPLALVEFAKMGSAGERALAPAGPLPLTDRLEQVYSATLDELPGATRQALLLAATDTGTPDGVAPEVWLPAEKAGLVRVRDGHVRFRHPLIRSAVYHAAAPPERHLAHLTWAEALHDVPDRRTRHLAAASSGPDESVAQALERTAGQVQQRGGFAAAAQALQQAGELSPERRDAARRFTRAAGIAILTGDTGWVEELTARVDSLTDDPVQLALAALRRGQALALTPRRALAYPLLLRTAETLARLHPAPALEALAAAALVGYYHGDVSQRDDFRRVLSLLGSTPLGKTPLGGTAKEHDGGLAELWIRAATDPPSGRAANLAELRRLVSAGPSGSGPLTALATVAWVLDETALAVSLFGAAAQSSPASARLPDALRCVAGWACLEDGEWTRARDIASGSIRAAAEARPPHRAPSALTLDAAVLALQGDSGAARESAMEALACVTARDTFVIVRARWALGMAAAAQGDHETAFDQFRMMFTADGSPVHYHASAVGLADLAAAAVRGGRRDEARTVVNRAARNLAHASPRQRALLSRAKALLAGPDDAERHFRAALDEPSGEDRPFEHALTQLDYAEWLRRQFRPSQARPLLAAGLETFRRLGAQPWTDRTLSELRAVGVREATSAPPTLRALTPQQQQIVHLAARGLTNREIGERLLLSPRTVSSHLYRSFPKLGVTARSQLRDLVDGTMADPRTFAHR